MQKQIGTAASVVLVAMILIAILGIGWYLVNPPPGPIGPKPGADAGFRHLGDGSAKTTNGFRNAPGRTAVPSPQ